ncbi:MAG: hypothetical protein ACTSRU_05435 [Candidatus Hodarchaeales archaeon]
MPKPTLDEYEDYLTQLMAQGIESGTEIGVGDTKIIKLEGERGSGKSHFWVREVIRAAEDVGAEEVISCCMDMDGGLKILFKNKVIVPVKYRRCFLRKIVKSYEDLYDTLNVFERVFRLHREKYPDGKRFIILENEAHIYESCVENYAVQVEGVGVGDLMVRRQVEAKAKGKFTQPLFPNKMQAYGAINYTFVKFFDNVMILVNETNGSLFWTTMIVPKAEYKDNEATGNWVRQVQGKPEKTDGYADVIAEFRVESEEKKRKGQLKITDKYHIILKKNRYGQRFAIQDQTPTKLFEALDAQIEGEELELD